MLAAAVAAGVASTFGAPMGGNNTYQSIIQSEKVLTRCTVLYISHCNLLYDQ